MERQLHCVVCKLWCYNRVDRFLRSKRVRRREVWHIAQCICYHLPVRGNMYNVHLHKKIENSFISATLNLASRIWRRSQGNLWFSRDLAQLPWNGVSDLPRSPWPQSFGNIPMIFLFVALFECHGSFQKTTIREIQEIQEGMRCTV